MTSYESANEAKSSFDNVYQAPTPHAYFAEMHRLGYAIGQEAKPYFQAAATLLRRQLGADPGVRMLDLGCSYGVGSALVRHGFSFSEIAEFFQQSADREFHACVDDTRRWVEENGSHRAIACVGADVSEPAVTFATEAGLLEDGIVHDLEADPELTAEERAKIANCNLLTSTGTIGYVGEKTLSAILRNLDTAHSLAHGPYAAVTILRMFSPEPIVATFARFGFRFERVPGVRLRQRRFADAREYMETMRLLERRHVDTAGWEETGHLYADLFIGARADGFGALADAIGETKRALADRASAADPTDESVATS